VPFFVCSIVMVDDRYGDFYLCIPLNILHQLMYNLACNKFPPGVAGVDRTSRRRRGNILHFAIAEVHGIGEK